jgi:amidase
MTALEQAEAIRHRELGSEELTRVYLERITDWNPRLAAFVTVLPRRALRAARRADRRLAADAPVLHGVPCAIKDIDMVRGAFVRAGSRAMRWVVAPVDGQSVRRIRAGGMVLLGKTATSELAIMPVTEPDIHPPTRNPWKPEHSAGGSSGGAAAAVAARLLPIAHASDGAGSIRIPAAFCHLYGFKPSRGLVPNFYAASDPFALSATGCVAHAVADAAAMLDVLRGRPAAADDSLLRSSELASGRLRVRLVVESPLVTVDPEVRAAVEHTAGVIEQLGHHVETGGPLAVGEVAEFLPLMARVVANVPVVSRRLLQPVTAWMHVQGRRVRPDDAARIARDLETRVLRWFGDVDLVLTPTVATVAPRIGAFRGLAPEKAFLAAAALGAFTAPFNASGQPAASLPIGLTRDGLPIGAQLVGSSDGDLRVLQVSRQLERAAPWRVRVAPLALAGPTPPVAHRRTDGVGA